MTKVIDHQAQSVVVDTTETFEEFANRIYKKQYPIQYKDGTSVELDPNRVYSTTLLHMLQLLTTEQFEKLFARIMGAVALSEAAGEIPAGVVAAVSTPLDFVPPKIPQQYIDALTEDEFFKILLIGSVQFAIQKHRRPVEMEEDEGVEGEEGNESA